MTLTEKDKTLLVVACQLAEEEFTKHGADALRQHFDPGQAESFRNSASALENLKILLTLSTAITVDMGQYESNTQRRIGNA